MVARVLRHDLRLECLDQMVLAQAHQAEATLAQARRRDGSTGALVAHHRDHLPGPDIERPLAAKTVQEPSAREGGSGASLRLGGRHRRYKQPKVWTVHRSTGHDANGVKNTHEPRESALNQKS